MLECVGSTPEFVVVMGEPFVAGEGVLVGEDLVSVDETARPPLLLPSAVALVFVCRAEVVVAVAMLT